MTAIDLSGDAGLLALALLTANILLGLLIAARYSPWKYWPHQRLNIFRVHNQVGLAALCASAAHPMILLFSRTAKFRWFDVVLPAWAPSQPAINLLGAAALYAAAFVLVTSHYRLELGRRTWKSLHFTTYAVAALAFLHGLFTDSHLNGVRLDPLDGEKLFVEGCLLLVLAATLMRIRHELRQRAKPAETAGSRGWRGLTGRQAIISAGDRACPNRAAESADPRAGSQEHHPTAAPVDS
ncbi:MAG TPA: ferric reductase-like transmembrane domain-containing protein [Candidatus Acidoferrales bacterium]|nr:ferric reductase-like transmembrane domain-containing protein [Candidatus Acidoferrales bacterium]